MKYHAVETLGSVTAMAGGAVAIIFITECNKLFLPKNQDFITA